MGNYIDNNFDYNDRITADNNFFIAAALTAYDGNTEIIEEARYGELTVDHYGWGYDENAIGSGGGPIEFHYCTDEELGFEPGPNTLIYPVFKTSLSVVTTWKKKFKCIDREDMVIWGDYNSEKAQQITFNFRMCEGHDYCETPEEIKKWLAGKYILLLYNQ